MYVIYFKRLLCYFIKVIIDCDLYNLLRIFSYCILICFKSLIFIINCFMQINRNYISIKLYYQIYKREINFIALDGFSKLDVHFTRSFGLRKNFLF